MVLRAWSAALLLAAAAAGGAAGQDAGGYARVGELSCEPEASWRWWTLIFSRRYFECHFVRDGAIVETYRGKVGVKPGVDLQGKALVFEVFVMERSPQHEVAPGELAGQYTAVKKSLHRDESVTLTRGDFRLQPVFTGIALGRIYLALEEPEED
jgi:hypothetical protein